MQHQKPIIEKHEKPVLSPRHPDRRKDYLRTEEPYRRLSDYDDMIADDHRIADQRLAFEHNLRQLEDQDHTRSHFKRDHHRGYPGYNIAPLSLAQTYHNEAFGDAMLEQNEKQRALELWRVSEEQSLKEEYDRKIMELTNDYKAKL